MPISRDQWLVVRQSATRPTRPDRSTPSATSCELQARADECFDVLIRGEHLRSGAVPPVIRIGDHPVRRVRGGAGTILLGVVDGGRVGDDVTVDLGPGGRTATTVSAVT